MDDEAWLRDPALWRLASSVEDDIDGVRAAARGIRAWTLALAEGRVPDAEKESGGWPEEGLREAYTEALEELDLLRFTARHPALAKAAVDALLRMVKSEKQRSRRAEEQEAAAAAAAAAATVVEEEDGDNNYKLYDDWEYFSEEETQEAVAVEEDGAEAEEKEEEASALEELGEDARLVLEAFRSELEAPLEGLGQLDGLLGDGHGLLAGSSGGGVGGGAAAAMGRQYGLADGVWRHSGWRAMAGVQVRMRYASPTLFYVHPTTLPTHRPEVDLFFSYHNLRFRFAFASLAPLLTAGEAPGHGRAAGPRGVPRPPPRLAREASPSASHGARARLHEGGAAHRRRGAGPTGGRRGAHHWGGPRADDHQRGGAAQGCWRTRTTRTTRTTTRRREEDGGRRRNKRKKRSRRRRS